MKGSIALVLVVACSGCSDDDGVRLASEAPPADMRSAAVQIEGESPANVDGAALTPPEQLRVLEFEIPALKNCSEGAAFPHDPAVDAATGFVYYTDSSRHCIGQFNPETLEFRAWPTATPGVEPHGLVVVDGVVYYTGWVANVMGVIDPVAGTTRDFPVAVSDPHTPIWQQGAVWFTGGTSQYGRFDPVSESSQIFDFPTAESGPYGIAPAPDGSAWVALFGTNRLGRIDTSAGGASAEEFVLPDAGARPRRLVVDARGRVWYSDYARGTLGMMDPGASEGQQFRQFPTPRGGRPYGIAVGPDARVWYADLDAAMVVGFDPEMESVVAELPLSPAMPGPVRNMAADPERQRVWLSLSDVGRLGVIQF
jgi:virginiamycin B lyase